MPMYIKHYRYNLRSHFIQKMKNSKLMEGRGGGGVPTSVQQFIQQQMEQQEHEHTEFQMRMEQQYLRQQQEERMQHLQLRQFQQEQQQQQQQPQPHQPHKPIHSLQQQQQQQQNPCTELHGPNINMKCNAIDMTKCGATVLDLTSGGDADTYLIRNLSRKYDSAYLRNLMNTRDQKQQTSPKQTENFLLQKYVNDEDNAALSDNQSVDSKGKSSKAPTSKRSSQDLRKMVLSQCKLHEDINRTLQHFVTDNGAEAVDSLDKIESPNDSGKTNIIVPNSCTNTHIYNNNTIQNNNNYDDIKNDNNELTTCKRCNERDRRIMCQRDVMTETEIIVKSAKSNDLYNVSIDDLVNTKVINPMIKKLQRMCINNLRDEMALLEELEGLPRKVNDVYKSTFFEH